MDRSIRKSIHVNELEYIFQLNGTLEDRRSQLTLELFENPQVQKRYLLKDDIRTLSALESRVRKIIDEQNVVSAILNIFSVKNDLIIPTELRETLFSNVKLAFFVGAGVSRLLKIPLWEELATTHAIDYLRDDNLLNYAEIGRLRDAKYTSKQILSIFHWVVKDKSKIKKFYEKYLAGQDNENGNPYELLSEVEDALAKPVLKISTNIDLKWEKVLKDKSDKQKQRHQDQQGHAQSSICYESTQYKDFHRDQELLGNVLHQIHGSMHDLDKATITTSQYIDNYRDENGLKGFLEKVFKEYVVLFIGSGIQEFEILEHCLKQSPFEHFTLVGTQADDENLFRIKKAYFSELRIRAIPYYLDFQGYDRFLFVLQSWVEEIRSAKKKQFYDAVKLIDEVLV